MALQSQVNPNCQHPDRGRGPDYSRNYVKPKNSVTPNQDALAAAWRAEVGPKSDRSFGRMPSPPKGKRKLNEMRKIILAALTDGPMTTAQIADLVGKTAHATSRHLRVMASEGLVWVERVSTNRARHNVYHLVEEGV